MASCKDCDGGKDDRKKDRYMSDSATTLIAEAVARELGADKPTDGEKHELFTNRTRQHALSASLGKPTPPNVREDGSVDEDNTPPARGGLSGALDTLMREVSRERRFNDDADGLDSEDMSDEAVLQKLVQAVLDRRAGK
jgi:hypothetical protein